MNKEISREEFERLVRSYATNICSEIIKNGFEEVESWVRLAMSETLNTKISQDKDEQVNKELEKQTNNGKTTNFVLQ